MSNSHKELLFCRDGLPYNPWDAQQLSSLVSDLLRRISGIETYTFHHLRHTALSNLQLIAEREWELCKEFTGYSLDQIESIFCAIFGSANEYLRIYWALACFAGHNSPQTSFQSYFHFSDLIIYLRLSNSGKSLNITQCKSLTDLSSNKLTRLVKDYKRTPDLIFITDLHSTLIKKLNQWISPCLSPSK